MNNMSWGLLEEYLMLHGEFETNPFRLDDASRVLNKPSRKLRYDMHVLSRNLALDRVDRGLYATVDPDKWAGITMALKKFPGLKPFFGEIIHLLPHIDSIMLYGSRVRGDHREDSDYDIFIVTDGRFLFTEEEEERLKKQGFQVHEGYETDLRKEIKEHPVFLVPMLKEAWPIFNRRVKRSLLRSYRREYLLKDLKEIGEELLNIAQAEISNRDVKRSIIFMSFARGRHLYLIESLVNNEPFYTHSWLEKMSELWGLKQKHVEELHRLYRGIENEEKPPVRKVMKKTLYKINEGNIKYLKDISNRLVEVLHEQEEKIHQKNKEED